MVPPDGEHGHQQPLGYLLLEHLAHPALARRDVRRSRTARPQSRAMSGRAGPDSSIIRFIAPCDSPFHVSQS
ncbi:hypothetical protein ACEZCY_34510 [Streptacidiphilus sp. N1-12]|uniref:Uncharacterized protein n=2 Tax=Streptacidiphilus alkalitolerans TaxID=3342712 RepID=A0ABV6WQQ7_9ACTN